MLYDSESFKSSSKVLSETQSVLLFKDFDQFLDTDFVIILIEFELVFKNSRVSLWKIIE